MTFLFTERPSARRKLKGSAISEAGPALFIIFVLFLFPMVDLVYLGAAYGISWYLNHLETKELSVNLPAQQAQILQEVDDRFVSQGMAAFVGITKTRIAHVDGTPKFSLTADPPTVRLVTRTTINPFLNIPFPVAVPGLNAPVMFKSSAVRVQEELGRD